MTSRREVLRQSGRPSVVLIIEDTEGDLMAVRFPTAEAARDWEESHPEVEARGVARYVSGHQALKELST